MGAFESLCLKCGDWKKPLPSARGSAFGKAEAISWKSCREGGAEAPLPAFGAAARGVPGAWPCISSPHLRPASLPAVSAGLEQEWGDPAHARGCGAAPPKDRPGARGNVVWTQDGLSEAGKSGAKMGHLANPSSGAGSSPAQPLRARVCSSRTSAPMSHGAR